MALAKPKGIKMLTKSIFLLTCFHLHTIFASAPGRTILQFPTQALMSWNHVQMSLYKNSEIIVKLKDGGDNKAINITWVLRDTPCAQEIYNNQHRLEDYLLRPDTFFDSHNKSFAYQLYNDVLSNKEHLEDHSNDAPITVTMKAPAKAVPAPETDSSKSNRTKREEEKSPEKNDELRKNSITTTTTTTAKAKTTAEAKGTVGRIARAWKDGMYILIIKATNIPVGENFTVIVEMIQPGGGYLQAMDWPLFPFYGALCGVYLVYGMAWLIMSGMNWKELLRIQFWIGGVIFLGMIEKAVYFFYFEALNTTGLPQHGVLVFGELISCLKRALARMLVVIVSLGFGIVKPRLGPMLHRVVGVGALYFLLSSIEGCMRISEVKSDNSRKVFLAGIPLAVLDAVICWWIFTSLIQTIRTLRVRRNEVKLSLYRHFTNTLIFAVLASVLYMAWSVLKHKYTDCLTDWEELWVDEAFWPMLFSILLLVIFILWRPSANNQRYAFKPLTDGEGEPEHEPMLNDAFEGLSMRGKSREGSPKLRNSTEDDMKWIEENIPTNVVDAALPSLLDSDDEIETTKYELSKME